MNTKLTEVEAVMYDCLGVMLQCYLPPALLREQLIEFYQNLGAIIDSEKAVGVTGA
jgi:hypothetical protein